MTSSDLSGEVVRHAIPLHRLGKDAEGRVILRERKGPVRFQFQYLGQVVHGDIEDSETHSRLRLRAELGRVPYTAESGDWRFNVLALAEAANEALGGVVRITPDQRIIAVYDDEMMSPLTGALLIGAITQFLLHIRPYLELILMIAPRVKKRRVPFTFPAQPVKRG
ncbi:MAG: hypothetical protein HQL45_12700 [Alphaproteobacteria bacterium]|nr:hypothetical protein [Alphaproteobacteria bacterium]MBF0355230.1 hypothetical protein [Alphaproteobacteria bacterium]